MWVGVEVGEGRIGDSVSCVIELGRGREHPKGWDGVCIIGVTGASDGVAGVVEVIGVAGVTGDGGVAAGVVVGAGVVGVAGSVGVVGVTGVGVIVNIAGNRDEGD